jgi:hypothetical protein
VVHLRANDRPRPALGNPKVPGAALVLMSLLILVRDWPGSRATTLVQAELKGTP